MTATRRAFITASLALLVAPLRRSRRGRCIGSGTWGMHRPLKPYRGCCRRACASGVGLKDRTSFGSADFSEGRNERFPALAVDLVQSKPDVIVTAGTAATLAAKAITTTIPI